MRPFSTCEVRWGSSLQAQNFVFILYDIWFTIPPPQICILPKPWFPIIGVAPTYPNLTNDNSFSSTWQYIMGQVYIIHPLPLTWLVMCWLRNKCPQHRLTQQVYFPVQVSKRQMSPKCNQDDLSLWSQIGTNCYLLPHDTVLTVSQRGWVGK